MTLRMLLAACVLVVFAGCGDDTATPNTTTTTATTLATATVEQYASVIAEHGDGVADAVELIAGCTGTPVSCDLDARNAMVDVADTAEQIRDGLAGLSEPPDEVGDLVERTATAAILTAQLGSRVSTEDCPNAPLEGECPDLLRTYRFQAEDLADALAAWGPYL